MRVVTLRSRRRVVSPPVTVRTEKHTAFHLCDNLLARALIDYQSRDCCLLFIYVVEVETAGIGRIAD